MKDLPDYIGPFRIIEKLGEGGFATVYLAHPKDQEKSEPVALKALASLENYGRFQREIETIATLKHPNIIQIYDTGVDEETKTPFYSMEYIPSGTLSDRLEADRCLPRDEAVEIIEKIGDALAYPHQRGIIHRDVNPKNILLDTRYTPIRPVLSDFGLVKALGPEAALFTETVALIGTFAYYAPEQWNKGSIGPATDVYALAITFFEMLAGRRPYHGDVFSLREKHLNEALPPLSEIAPEIGTYFDEVLTKATAKNPRERFQTIEAFIEAIKDANEKTEQAAIATRQESAIKTVNDVQKFMEQGSYDHQQLLDTLELALEEFPDYSEALWLRGKIRLKQEQFLDALPDFELVHAQTDSLDSEKELDYLQALQQSAKSLWQNQDYAEALKHLTTMQKMVSNDLDRNGTIHDWQIARLNLIQAHYEAGLEAYASGDPEDIHLAIGTLKQEAEALLILEAETERQVLVDVLKKLQIKEYYLAGLEVFADGEPEDIDQAMDTLKSKIRTLQDLNAQEQNQELKEKLKILQIKIYHSKGVEAFCDGNPEDVSVSTQVLTSQIESLQSLDAQVEATDLQNKVDRLQINTLYNQGLQSFAEGKSRHPTETIATLKETIEALKPYNAEPERQDLSEKLTSLQTQERREAKYAQVQELITEQKYSEALTCLDQEFIQSGHYEYRDTAQLLWKLVYAKQNGEFPNDVLSNEDQSSDPEKKMMHHEFNRYLIPLSLIIAVLAGTTLSFPFPGWGGVAAIAAWTLIAAYFGYYVWSYYIDTKTS